MSSWYQELPSGNPFLSDVIKEMAVLCVSLCRLLPSEHPRGLGDTPWWCPASAVLETEWVVRVPPGSDWELTDKNHEFWGRIWEVCQLNNKSLSQRAAISQIQHFYRTIRVFYRKIFLSHMKYYELVLVYIFSLIPKCLLNETSSRGWILSSIIFCLYMLVKT